MSVDESREAYHPGCQVRSQARPALERWPGRYARAHGSADGSSGEQPGQPASLIDEIVREGARRMLAEALRAEVDAYIAAFAAERDEDGRRGGAQRLPRAAGGADQRR